MFSYGKLGIAHNLRELMRGIWEKNITLKTLE